MHVLACKRVCFRPVRSCLFITNTNTNTNTTGSTEPNRILGSSGERNVQKSPMNYFVTVNKLKVKKLQFPSSEFDGKYNV